MAKLVLPNASSERGAQMGRPNSLPDDKEAPIKLRMEALKFIDGDYDHGGAYWGYTAGTAIYCAWGEDEKNQVRIFVRAKNRNEAKEMVKEILPAAEFWR